MADTTTQEYVTREPEWMEALRRALLEDARGLTKQRLDIPEYQVAGVTPQQLQALRMAQSGIGAYQPYLAQARQQYGSMAGFGQQEVNALMQGYGRAQPYFGRSEAGYGQGVEDVRAGYGRAQPLMGESRQAYGQGVSDTRAGMGRAQRYIGGAEQEYGGAGSYADVAERQAVRGTREYDPDQVREYMDPYQKLVTRQALQEMNRQAGIQQQSVSSQAAKAGAFGGSRFGVQQAELGRNLADVQSSAITRDYSQNFSQAQQAAMNAFQNQQARQLQAAQTSLGAGQLSAQAGAGLAALGQQQFGMGQALGQTEMQRAAGMSSLAGQQFAMGQGLSAADFQRAQGLASIGQQQFAMGQGIAQGYQNRAALAAQAGAGMANLGQQATTLGQADTSFLYNMGTNFQAQQQKLLDANRMNQQLYNMEPYQRLSYYADLLNRTPSGQMGYSQYTQPSPSPFSQFAGLGIAGLGAYNQYQYYNRPYGQ